VHLAAADPWPGGAANALPVPARGRPGGVSRSCHTRDDLRAAAARGAAWASYSPVFRTPSKPGYGPPLGAEGLAAAHRAVPDLPLAALGGIDHTNAAACAAAGAGLVAVMGAVMAAADPGAEVAALRAALDRRPAPTGASGRTR
jgi:thiamine-phosphate pyrophosphorylase